MSISRFGIPWTLTEFHGWGLVGVHTALFLAERGVPPVLLSEPMLQTMRPQTREALAPLLEPFRQVMDYMRQTKAGGLKLSEVDVMHPLGNQMIEDPNASRFQGRRNIGVIAFENTRLGPDEVARAKGFDFMVAHSTFNVELLREAGIADVRLAFQGIDPTEMFPVPRRGVFANRFVVFSGGKLEFRKGQDIVLEGFRRFHQRHPDALLVTAWHNPWPQTARDMAQSPHARVPVRTIGNQLDITGWAVENGLPPHGFFDLGFMTRDRIAKVLAECDAAVFPNRCEGATNLVAMEAMGCGVPVVLSANTGHRDILIENGCWPLSHQTPTPDPQGERRHWGESSPDELVEALEQIYTGREESRARAAVAMNFIHKNRTWRKFAEVFVAECSR
ncbi:MAG: glycosyltransferase family 4 protein [Caulobacter sp.]|nr:glycosyltransferase family 4 protein [Caulobacter sp.]